MPTPPEPAASPPVKITKGLSTYAGLAGASAAILPLVIDTLTDERIDAGTRTALIVAGAVLLGLVIVSRTAQAVAAELARGRRGLVIGARPTFSSGEPILTDLGPTAGALDDPALDDPDGGDEPELTDAALEGRTAHDPLEHSRLESAAYDELDAAGTAKPTPHDLEENNAR